MESTSSRFMFDSLESATESLRAALENARRTDRTYRCSSSSASEMLHSGMILTGELDEIIPILEAIPGVVRYDE